MHKFQLAATIGVPRNDRMKLLSAQLYFVKQCVILRRQTHMLEGRIGSAGKQGPELARSAVRQIDRKPTEARFLEFGAHLRHPVLDGAADAQSHIRGIVQRRRIVAHVRAISIERFSSRKSSRNARPCALPSARSRRGICTPYPDRARD